MATATPRLGLRKPEDSAPDDAVDVTIDIADSMDKLDSAVGANRGTSFPVTPFLGNLFVRSDQQERLYYWTGTAWLIMANGPYCELRGTNTSIPDSTDTAVPFATEITDSDNGHDPVTNNSRYTFPFKGIYRVTARVGWASAGGAFTAELSLRLGGTTKYLGTREGTPTGINYVQIVTKDFNVNAGQYVEAVVSQSQSPAAARLLSVLDTNIPMMEVSFIRSLP